MGQRKESLQVEESREQVEEVVEKVGLDGDSSPRPGVGRRLFESLQPE